jgi:hypothetical protein
VDTAEVPPMKLQHTAFLWSQMLQNHSYRSHAENRGTLLYSHKPCARTLWSTFFLIKLLRFLFMFFYWFLTEMLWSIVSSMSGVFEVYPRCISPPSWRWDQSEDGISLVRWRLIRVAFGRKLRDRRRTNTADPVTMWVYTMQTCK